MTDRDGSCSSQLADGTLQRPAPRSRPRRCLDELPDGLRLLERQRRVRRALGGVAATPPPARPRWAPRMLLAGALAAVLLTLMLVRARRALARRPGREPRASPSAGPASAPALSAGVAGVAFPDWGRRVRLARDGHSQRHARRARHADRLLRAHGPSDRVHDPAGPARRNASGRPHRASRRGTDRAHPRRRSLDRRVRARRSHLRARRSRGAGIHADQARRVESSVSAAADGLAEHERLLVVARAQPRERRVDDPVDEVVRQGPRRCSQRWASGAQISSTAISRSTSAVELAGRLRAA